MAGWPDGGDLRRRIRSDGYSYYIGEVTSGARASEKRERGAVNRLRSHFEEGSYRFGDRKGLELGNWLCYNLLQVLKKRVLLRRGFLSGSSYLYRELAVHTG